MKILRLMVLGTLILPNLAGTLLQAQATAVPGLDVPAGVSTAMEKAEYYYFTRYNLGEALKCYKQAAKQGNPLAQ